MDQHPDGQLDLISLKNKAIWPWLDLAHRLPGTRPEGLMKRAVLCACYCTLFAASGFADIYTFSTTADGPLSYQADTFKLNGESGTLNLSTTLLTTANINSATLTIGDSGGFNGSEVLTLTYNLTLDGVTHALSQQATWTVTPSQDSFITIAESAPVLFNLGANGEFLVKLDAYNIPGTAIGQATTIQTAADFTPAPEPQSIALVAIELLGIAVIFGRRLRRSEPLN